MDGVIIDSEMEYLKYIYEFAKEKNPDILIEDLYGTVGTTKRDCWIVVEKAVDNGESWEELRQQDVYKRQVFYNFCMCFY